MYGIFWQFCFLRKNAKDYDGMQAQEHPRSRPRSDQEFPQMYPESAEEGDQELLPNNFQGKTDVSANRARMGHSRAAQRSHALIGAVSLSDCYS